MKIICPACRRATTWEENPTRPFCSARCKELDLGRWATGAYRIAGEPMEEEGRESEGTGRDAS